MPTINISIEEPLLKKLRERKNQIGIPVSKQLTLAAKKELEGGSK